MTNASSTETNALAQNPFFTLTTKIFNVYSDTIRQNMEELTVSSTKIIQEETMRAWTNAAQSCSKALAENAMSHQQQFIQRITTANQKAFGILAVDLSPLKIQPMVGVANWFPYRTSTSSNTSSLKLDESSSPKKEGHRRRQ